MMTGTSLAAAALYVETEPERMRVVAGSGFAVGLGLSGLATSAVFELTLTRLAINALCVLVAFGIAALAMELYPRRARERCAFCDHALASRVAFFAAPFEAHVVDALRTRDASLLRNLPAARRARASVELECASCTGCGTVARVRCRVQRGGARVSVGDAVVLGPEALAFAAACVPLESTPETARYLRHSRR